MKNPELKQFRNSPYYVSQDGDVYRHCGEFSITPFQYRKRKPKMNNSGYKILTISSTAYLIHNLVAEVWICPRPEGMVCNHKDGNKLNNHYLNLEWVTRQQNQQHAIDMGLQAIFRGSHSSGAKVTEADIPVIRASTKTNRELGEEYGLSTAMITSIRNYRSWKHVPLNKPIVKRGNNLKKFTDEQVRAIRAGKFGPKKTARIYGCSPKTIKMIRARISYKYVL